MSHYGSTNNNINIKESYVFKETWCITYARLRYQISSLFEMIIPPENIQLYHLVNDKQYMILSWNQPIEPHWKDIFFNLVEQNVTVFLKEELKKGPIIRNKKRTMKNPRTYLHRDSISIYL